jgi:hypothetical protein
MHRRLIDIWLRTQFGEFVCGGDGQECQSWCFIYDEMIKDYNRHFIVFQGETVEEKKAEFEAYPEEDRNQIIEYLSALNGESENLFLGTKFSHFVNSRSMHSIRTAVPSIRESAIDNYYFRRILLLLEGFFTSRGKEFELDHKEQGISLESIVALDLDGTEFGQFVHAEHFALLFMRNRRGRSFSEFCKVAIDYVKINKVPDLFVARSFVEIDDHLLEKNKMEPDYVQRHLRKYNFTERCAICQENKFCTCGRDKFFCYECVVRVLLSNLDSRAMNSYFEFLFASHIKEITNAESDEEVTEEILYDMWGELEVSDVGFLSIRFFMQEVEDGMYKCYPKILDKFDESFGDHPVLLEFPNPCFNLFELHGSGELFNDLKEFGNQRIPEFTGDLSSILREIDFDEIGEMFA